MSRGVLAFERDEVGRSPGDGSGRRVISEAYSVPLGARGAIFEVGPGEPVIE